MPVKRSRSAKRVGVLKPIVRKKRRKTPGRWSAIDKITLDKVKKLIDLKQSDAQIAKFFNLTPEALAAYKKKHPKFFERVKDWRIEAVKAVEKNLFNLARDRDVEEVTTEEGRNDKVGAFKSNKVLKKKVLANVEAAKFILTNHMGDQYKNRQDNKNINLNGQPDDKAFTDQFFGVG